MASNVPVLTKQPGETRTITFDFTDKLAADDTLTGSATMTYPSGLTEVSTARSGNLVNSRFSGGSDDTVYRVTCECGTTNGDELHLDVDILVDEDAN